MPNGKLLQYIHNKTNLPQDQLRPIFKMMDKQVFDFSKSDTEAILFSAKQKAKIALAALQERLSKGEIAAQYEVNPNQVSLWKKQAMDGLETIFEDGRKKADSADDQNQTIEQLYQTAADVFHRKEKIPPIKL